MTLIDTQGTWTTVYCVYINGYRTLSCVEPKQIVTKVTLSNRKINQFRSKSISSIGRPRLQSEWTDTN